MIFGQRVAPSDSEINRIVQYDTVIHHCRRCQFFLFGMRSMSKHISADTIQFVHFIQDIASRTGMYVV